MYDTNKVGSAMWFTTKEVVETKFEPTLFFDSKGLIGAVKWRMKN